MYIYVIIYDISCLKKHWISSVIPFPAFPWKLHGIVLSFDLLLGPHDVAPRASLLIAFLMHSTPGVQSVESGRGNGNDKVKQPIESMYGIFTYTFTIKINQSCMVNIYHTWILWAMSNNNIRGTSTCGVKWSLLKALKNHSNCIAGCNHPAAILVTMVGEPHFSWHKKPETAILVVYYWYSKGLWQAL